MQFTRAVKVCLYLLSGLTSLSQTYATGERTGKTPARIAYEKTVDDAIREPWIKMMKREYDLVTLGTLRVTFSILPDGHIENLRAISNTSTQYFEMATLRVIEHAHIPPIPESLLKTLPGHRIEMEAAFESLSP
jgi:outer membrane biosynthesis protein TonB